MSEIEKEITFENDLCDQSLLVTGGAGFIGSHVVEYLLSQGAHVTLVDSFLPPASRSFVRRMAEDYRKLFTLVEADVCDLGRMKSILFERKITGIFHLAAQTHVDNSLAEGVGYPTTTLASTVVSTESLLRAVVSIGKPYPRFVYISTDEIYGAAPDGVSFKEDSPLNPSNPYSACKVAAECLVRSYGATYGIPYVITRGENTYGERQYIEKLLPKALYNLLILKQPIPIYGQGLQRRCWISAEDHAKGIVQAYQKGKDREIYNLGTGIELTNISLITELVNIVAPEAENTTTFVEDRIGHDFAYRIDSTKARETLGFAPKRNILADLLVLSKKFTEYIEAEKNAPDRSW